MKIGKILGKKEITKLMANHLVAKDRFPKYKRWLFFNFGWLLIKIFGYPLGLHPQKKAVIVLKLLDPKAGETICDIGCGIGYYSFELSKNYNCNIYGIDIDNADIQLAKKIKEILDITNVTFSNINVLDNQFEDSFFDKIIMLEVIEHIKDDVALLFEIKRILKPKGKLILSTPFVNNVIEYDKPMMDSGKYKVRKEASGHFRNGYSKEFLSTKLEEACLSLDSFEILGKCLICKAIND